MRWAPLGAALAALGGMAGAQVASDRDRVAYRRLIESLDSDLPHFFVLHCGREAFDNPCACDEDGRFVACSPAGDIEEIVLPDNRLFGRLDVGLLRAFERLQVVNMSSSSLDRENIDRNVLVDDPFSGVDVPCVDLPECWNGEWLCDFQFSRFSYCAPTASPTRAPVSSSPTSSPQTSAPSVSPTSAPSASPSTPTPSASPSTGAPSGSPTAAPSAASPTGSPTSAPSASTTTGSPTAAPSAALPTGSPTSAPSAASPTAAPTDAPTGSSGPIPTVAPTGTNTANPTAAPTATVPQTPTAAPSATPSQAPSAEGDTSAPTSAPSATSGTQAPTMVPTAAPSSENETGAPTAAPSTKTNGTAAPSTAPTAAPSTQGDTAAPTAAPSTESGSDLNPQDFAAWQTLFDNLGGTGWRACSTRSDPCSDPACAAGNGGERFVACAPAASMRGGAGSRRRRQLQGSGKRIVGIQLPDNGMVGVIPSGTLDRMSALRTLNLTGNAVVGDRASSSCVEAQLCFEPGAECAVPFLCGPAYDVGGTTAAWAPDGDYSAGLDVRVTDSVRFLYPQGQSDVWLLPSQEAFEACDFTAATQVASTEAGAVAGGFLLPVPPSALGTTLWAASSMPGPSRTNCRLGQRVAIRVQVESPTTAAPTTSRGGVPTIAPTASPTATAAAGIGVGAIIGIVIGVLVALLLLLCLCCLCCGKGGEDEDEDKAESGKQPESPRQLPPPGMARGPEPVPGSALRPPQVFVDEDEESFGSGYSSDMSRSPRGPPESAPKFAGAGAAVPNESINERLFRAARDEEMARRMQLSHNNSLQMARREASRVDRAVTKPIHDVGELLRRARLEHHREAFDREGVDLEAATFATEAQLMALGLTLGEAVKLKRITDLIRRGVGSDDRRTPPPPPPPHGQGTRSILRPSLDAAPAEPKFGANERVFIRRMGSTTALRGKVLSVQPGRAPEHPPYYVVQTGMGSSMATELYPEYDLSPR